MTGNTTNNIFDEDDICYEYRDDCIENMVITLPTTPQDLVNSQLS